MGKIAIFLFVGSLLTLVACQVKPKTDEANVDSTATMSTDTTTMSTDTASTMLMDSTSMMKADSVK